MSMPFWITKADTAGSRRELTLSAEARVAAVTHVSPKNRFVEFSIDETEQSISERFEKQVRKYPRHIAVQTSHVQLTYNDLNALG